ncbi:hypothetical protein HanXRQr2_Chr08g0331691 [Helianthus annuus]|uniref:Uncharacterized protein n=1 Tax=Helianthus annuus TaxID=4232 RepID=A0A251U469_HELAN|nr:hypothetical protein HanXRQr2_Chr08g0331691 [Helianthus annuus]KAJ0901042.1 hypothetical protein HanPSC8_Chr08g0320701 [Helianthus annuus]
MMFICLNYLRTCHLQGIELILIGEDVHQHEFPKKIKMKFRSLQKSDWRFSAMKMKNFGIWYQRISNY